MERRQFANVWYEKREGMAFITLDDQPKRNALSPGIRSGLRQAFDEVDRDEEVLVGIITGAGKSFCAGGDISGLSLDVKSARRFLDDVIGVLHRPEKVIKPLIAAVNGFALGGGTELALACDIIIASENATFGTPEPLIGLCPGFAVFRLGELVGRHRAKEVILTADQFPAAEMYRMGLVNKVVPPDQLMEEAIAMARRITKCAPLAVQFAKSAINRKLGGEDIAYAKDGMAYLFGTEDAKNGIAAFMNKQKVVFQGR